PPLALVEALRRPGGPEPDIDFWSDVLDDEESREARETSPESGPKVRGRSWEILDEAEPEEGFDEEPSEEDQEPGDDEEEVDELDGDEESEEPEDEADEPKIVARKKDAEP